tara:strand:- start:1003 stop:1263 length:261 start_codon:yes stop_codon:yes gene_type:complete
MELPEDIMNLRDLNKNIEYIAEDVWARIFGLTLSVSCPNDRAKELFINFVTKKYKEDLIENEKLYVDTEYCYNLITEFINYLVDRG